MAQDHRRAVSGDFDYVVGSVGVRFGKISDDDFVDTLMLIVVWSVHSRRLGFNKFSQHCSPRFEIMLEAQHGQNNAPCLRTSDADDTNAAATRRRGDGDDGIVEIHSYLWFDQGIVFRGRLLTTAL